MRLNENTVIFGDRVILVPYRAEHVPTYHEWMKSPELLELTASEPLSYEEELEMQRKWHLDDDKLTFILLAQPETSTSTSNILEPSEIKKCKMVGDVNLFLPDGITGQGECEIMIASKEDRRKGYAIEALSLFLSYLIITLPFDPSHLIARIGSSNKPSIRLFQKLGFGIIKHVKVFDEVELNFGVEDIKEILSDLGLHVGINEKVDWINRSLEGRLGKYD